MVHVLLTGTIEENLAWLTSRLKQYYDANGVQSRFVVLRLTMFSPAKDDYPVLKGKASRIRYMGRALTGLMA